MCAYVRSECLFAVPYVCSIFNDYAVIMGNDVSYCIVKGLIYLFLPTCLYLLMLIQLACNTTVNSIHTLARCKYTTCLGNCQEQILKIPEFVTPTRQLVPSQP